VTRHRTRQGTGPLSCKAAIFLDIPQGLRCACRPLRIRRARLGWQGAGSSQTQATTRGPQSPLTRGRRKRRKTTAKIAAAPRVGLAKLWSARRDVSATDDARSHSDVGRIHCHAHRRGDHSLPRHHSGAGCRTEPSTEGLQLVRRVAEGLLGRPLAVEDLGWSQVSLALKATGRESLSARDRTVLGPLADCFPLFD
jgi:hypothetical protein